MSKNILYSFLFSIFFLSGCYNDDYIESKPGASLEAVSNLNYEISGDEVILTWDLPQSYPEGVIEPVSVQISTLVNGNREAGNITLSDNPESYTYIPYDSANEYRFTVKVMADYDATEPHVSDLLYSLGNTIEF